ncbi:unnamed protein product [Vicia faba]|uniref:Glutathione peroxidase n=1 Tax=Vicia faba TaxID=3906 RepID=A0AAV1AML6_VICFA|nr:unnamed protein product [Vicia faba]
MNCSIKALRVVIDRKFCFITAEAVAGSTAWLGRSLSCVCVQRRDSDASSFFYLTLAQEECLQRLQRRIHVPYDSSIIEHQDIDKKDVSLSKFKGEVLLIVNVASRCGLTSSNYTELPHLYENFKDRGLEVLAFPCNQFGMQEPGSNEEIKQFACTKFKAEFPIFDKVDVNGPFTAPVYQFLKSSSGGFFGDLVKWNLN